LTPSRTIAFAGDHSATFTVAYFDQGNGSFGVQYDDGSSDPYRSASPSIPLNNTNTWKTATVSASDVHVGGKQHSSADFRLRNGSGQVTVHSVVVSITGAWSCTPTSGLTDGQHVLSAKSTDVTGLSATSASVPVTVQA
jgi:hypothetical protein